MDRQDVIEDSRSRIAALEAELAALRAEHARFVQICGDCPTALAVVDRSRRYVYLNARFAALTGASREALLEQPVDAATPELARAFGPLLDEVLQSGAPRLRVETRRASPAEPGRPRDWVSSWIPLRDAEGGIAGVSIAVEETTEQREAEARFRVGQEVSPDGFVILRALRDGGGKVEDFLWEYANPAAQATIGGERWEVVGQRLLERLPGAGRHADMFPRYLRCLQSGETTAAEVEYHEGDISGWFRVTVARIDAERVALSFRDITGRKRIEQDLRASERRLSAVLANTRMAVFLMDADRRCAYMNDAAETLTGYRFDETRGRSLHEVIHHSRPDGTPYPVEDCPIDRAFPEDHQIEGEEVFVHKDGHFFPVAFTASPIREEGAAIGTVIEVRDITCEKADQQRLGELIDELNHRVKNTLSTVQAIFLQAMRGRAFAEAGPEAVRDAVLARIRALSRSHDLLTERSWGSASFRDVVLRALAPFAGEEGPDRRVTVAGRNPELRPKQALALAMGFHELATNATRYGALSDPEGRVEIGCEIEPGGMLRVTWRETGGPPVPPPGPGGFGRRLIEQGLAHDLEGETRLAFEPGGLRFEIRAPAAPILAGPLGDDAR